MTSTMYSPVIRSQFIDIPRPLITFFKQRNREMEHYVEVPRSSKEGPVISYKNIEGEQAEEVPPEYTENEELRKTTEEFTFTNKDDAAKEAADRVTIQALNALFGNNRHGDIKKTYMLHTSTMPIKINFSENGKKSKTDMYVKYPDTNRIIGRFLYDIISGIEGIRYAFNRLVFLEEGISGNTLSHINESVYLSTPEYKDGLVKAAIHADFLGLYQDVVLPRNRIIDSQMRTILFDFNMIFRKKEKGAQNYLLDEYLRKHKKLDKRMIQAYLEEQHRVGKRLEEEEKTLSKFARMTGQLIDPLEKMTIDEMIRNYFGTRNLEEYFEKKVAEYRVV